MKNILKSLIAIIIIVALTLLLIWGIKDFLPILENII